MPQSNLCESETGKFVHTDNLYESARREVLTLPGFGKSHLRIQPSKLRKSLRPFPHDSSMFHTRTQIAKRRRRQTYKRRGNHSTTRSPGAEPEQPLPCLARSVQSAEITQPSPTRSVAIR